MLIKPRKPIKEKVMAEEESHRSNTESFTEESDDRISELPDCLLLHILSFRSLEEAVRTSLLSKRWQFIWTGTLKVDFWRLRRSDVDDDDEDEEIHKPKSWDWVGKMLAMCNYLKTLNVRLEYGDFLPSAVDQWIHIAIKNKVKCITLDFYDCNESGGNGEVLDELYEIPEEFYSYSSLTRLTLDTCVLAPQGILTWESLKSLIMEEVKLSDSLMEKILSGCPVLEFLRLEKCKGLNNLNIYSPNLTTLEIMGFDDEIPNITAPYLLNLRINNWLKKQDCLNEHYMLKNLSSIGKVNLQAWGELSTNESTMDHMKQILQSLESAKKKISLSTNHLEVISSLEVEGRKFPLFIQLRSLKFIVWTDKMSTIPGILALVRSAPNLKALKIDIIQHRKDIPSDEAGVSLDNYATDLVASHLKTVKIMLLNGRDFVNEYILTLLPILLKSAKVLEEMTIKVKETKHNPLPPNTLLDPTKVVERLLTFPRTSSKAVIVPRL